jgi:hypothetical protein
MLSHAGHVKGLEIFYAVYALAGLSTHDVSYLAHKSAHCQILVWRQWHGDLLVRHTTPVALCLALSASQ